MRLFRVSFILLLCFVIGYRAEAQTCNGTFGDPVVKESFDQPGPLPAGQTGMSYEAGTCPNDTWYSISKSLTDPSCHLDAWHRVYADHTGNGGYMMIINASDQRSQFFERSIDNLCPNTTYLFSVFVMDLMKQSADGPGVKHPKLRFTITDDADNILQTASRSFFSTSTAEFKPASMVFTTSVATGKIKLKIFNDEDGGNGNDLIIDDISFSACGPVATSGVDGYSTGTNPPPVCEGDNATYTLSTTVSGTYEYQWQHFENGDWVDIPGANSLKHRVLTGLLPAGVHQYRMAIANPGNMGSPNCRSFTQISSITVNALPVVSNINDESVCENADITLRPTGGATYALSGPGVNKTNVTSPFTLNNLTLANSGTYTIRATSATGCEGPPQSFNITVKRDFTVTATASVNEVCKGTSVNLSAGPDEAGYTYKWTPSTGLDRDDIANPVATPLTTTAYTVTVSNGSCAYPSSPVTIIVLQPPLASIASRKVIFEGQSLQLNPTVSGDITTYSWWPETGLSDPHILNPIASPTDDITYTLTVNSALCEPDTAVIFVKVYKTVTIPNTFTPNADGVNDTWNMEALTTYPESETHVYNRNGQEVFRSIGYSKAWNGTFNGQPLPAGTYYYIIDLKNNTAKRTGYVTILR